MGLGMVVGAGTAVGAAMPVGAEAAVGAGTAVGAGQWEQERRWEQGRWRVCRRGEAKAVEIILLVVEADELLPFRRSMFAIIRLHGLQALLVSLVGSRGV